jgi:hypothetical protein
MSRWRPRFTHMLAGTATFGVATGAPATIT